MTRGQKLDAGAKDVSGRRHVASIQRSSARGEVAFCRSRCQPLHMLTGLSELCPIGVGPLEVVAQDLLELGEPIAGGLLEPVREALVEDRPLSFRQGSV